MEQGVTFHLHQPQTACNGWARKAIHVPIHLSGSQLSDHLPSPDPKLMNNEMELDYAMADWEQEIPDTARPEPQQAAAAHAVLVASARRVEHFPGAACVHKLGETFLDHFNMDPYTMYCSHLLTLPLSFWMARELHGCAKSLPTGPQWNFRIVPTSHPTKCPVHMYYCNSLDYIKALFNHPYFAGNINFSPFRAFTAVEHVMREYSKWMSSDGARDMQSKLPARSTLCGMILSSDKTNITNVCGVRVAHPLLISLTDMRMNVWNKVSSHTFLLMALMPIADFTHPVMRMCLVLDTHLFHACLNIILEPLKVAACIGQMMSDPACKPFRLSGVSQPFWHDWPLSDPSTFLTPKALHHWHREFLDHDVKWCKQALGAAELDFCFSALPSITGLKHFKSGITTLKQVGGRTQCDVQRYIIVVIAGAANPDVVVAIHTMAEFHYLSQAPVITTDVHKDIVTALSEFHTHKQPIIEAGLHQGDVSKAILEHWDIPKLKLMHSVSPSIAQVSSLLQWSADTTEHAHIKVIKDPAATTNNKNYDSQICCYLDHMEKCRMFNTAMQLHEIAIMTSASNELDDDNADSKLGEDAIYEAEEHDTTIFADLWSLRRSPMNFFMVAATISTAAPGPVSCPPHTFIGGSTAIHLNYHASIQHIVVNSAAETFNIPDLCAALGNYLIHNGALTQNFHSFGGQRQSSPDVHLPFKYLQVWYKVHVQQKAYHNKSSVASISDHLLTWHPTLVLLLTFG
ncbi:hypothetical protein PAXRUDRAFT_36607 [Paxillus rubicundulus Ve08.2h10]|uniref:DUF6830 domain-containing protein n=1 Tax=Paxillus rubicundulus Ve08.2h10 TaxID=930991 RepID=A0A0D0DD22_9AGAM|nr:hypothetical protein PAXRUDRAFT_36607 [Paxillus rubicundulus Ve08.2h10]